MKKKKSNTVIQQRKEGGGEQLLKAVLKQDKNSLGQQFLMHRTLVFLL